MLERLEIDVERVVAGGQMAVAVSSPSEENPLRKSIARFVARAALVGGIKEW